MTATSDTKLLEVDFIEYCSQRWYGFVEDAMLGDVDNVGYQYDFTDETPETDLHYSVMYEASRWAREQWMGEQYFVTRDYCGNIAIYKFVDEVMA